MLYCLLIQIKELLLIGSSCSGSVTLDFPNLLFSFFTLLLILFVARGMHLPQYTCGGQRTTF